MSNGRKHFRLVATATGLVILNLGFVASGQVTRPGQVPSGALTDPPVDPQTVPVVQQQPSEIALWDEARQVRAVIAYDPSTRAVTITYTNAAGAQIAVANLSAITPAYIMSATGDVAQLRTELGMLRNEVARLRAQVNGR